MLKIISKNMFDAFAGLMIVAAVFYLAAVTHIIPLPENTLKHVDQFSLDVMDVLVAWYVWLISFLP